jgi:hypothetical protein
LLFLIEYTAARCASLGRIDASKQASRRFEAVRGG